MRSIIAVVFGFLVLALMSGKAKACDYGAPAAVSFGYSAPVTYGYSLQQPLVFGYTAAPAVTYGYSLPAQQPFAIQLGYAAPSASIRVDRQFFSSRASFRSPVRARIVIH